MRRGVFVVAAGAALAAVAAEVGRRQFMARFEPQPDMSGAPLPGAVAPTRAQASGAANARLLPPRWEPAPLTALSEWVPPAPSRPLGRAGAYLWASPLTVAGLIVGLLTGRRPRIRDGVILFENAGGIPGRLIRLRRFSAGALGHVVIAVDRPSDTLLAHELVHVRQAERLGPLMAPLYVGLLAVYGYARHPLERAARRGARRHLGITD